MENEQLYRVAVVDCKSCGASLLLKVIGLADKGHMPMHIYAPATMRIEFTEPCSACNQVHIYESRDVQVVHQANVLFPIGWMSPSFAKATAPEPPESE